MFKNKFIFFFLGLFVICIVPASLWTATASVTNDGNITVRVQYKTPDGQYQDLGHVKPGETMDVPGGVEKVRIVREPGEWAAPLKPGEVLYVKVKEGGKITGKMNWYGDKVYFNPPTEGLPPVKVGNVPQGNQPSQNPQPPKEEPKPESSSAVQPELKSETGSSPGSQTSNWPWYGGINDSVFFIHLLMMWPFLFFLWYRSWRQPNYYIEGELVENSELSWGWGWQRGGGCFRLALFVSLVLGVSLAAVALWGHVNFNPNDGLLPRFGEDLYSFPYFLFSLLGWGMSGLSEVSFIFLFWILTCTSFGLVTTLMPAKWLYATPLFLAILPFFLLTRGCAGCFGPEHFAFDGGYEGVETYPGAFASFFYFASYLLLFWIGLILIMVMIKKMKNVTLAKQFGIFLMETRGRFWFF